MITLIQDLSSALADAGLGIAILPILLTLCVVCLHEFYVKYSAHRLPPGRSGLMSFFELPKENPWLMALKFNQQHGDIASISLFGNHIIIVGSAEIAEDLLHKNGANYADRPRSVMCGELSGWGKIMLLAKCDERYRTHRKWVAQDIGSYTIVAKSHDMIQFETRRFLQSVLDNPGKLQAHVRKNFTSIVLRLSHGYVTQMGDDHLVEIADEANAQLSKTTAFGIQYVDFIPQLKYIPSWFPGAGFKRAAKEYALVVRDMVEIPHKYMKSQMANGTALPSLSSRIMNTPNLTDDLEDSVKWAAASMFQGGADTPNSVAYAFYLAMTLYPCVMKKAQEELDRMVGTSRLPTFNDRASLPYMEALFTELLRWHTPAPLTIRSAKVDEVYNGYLIPAGSYVVANIWAMLRDENVYSDPLEFRPERFLGDNPEPHPGNVCFGLGRRKCPGYFLAHSTIWLMCAQSLAVFDISKSIKNGVAITPEHELVGETIVHQAPFPCSIKVRSSQAELLIRQEFPL